MAIAILDPDKSTVTVLADLLDEMGETPQPFTDKDKFLGAISPTAHRIAIISDDFLDVIEGTKQVYQSIDIVATGMNGSEGSILAGASHYLKKPFLADDFRQVIQALLHAPAPRGQASAWSFIASDPAMKKIIGVLNKVAPTQAPVFIQGESGTGKEVIARYIHQMSRRAGGPYVGINLAAIPDTLLESELFGYEKGAFTGAYATRVGKFELAGGGTILLDEVTEISGGLQAKLLRVLQERQIDRVGSKAPIPVDFRVIATTNRDIESHIRDGAFRRDLYFRLNVIPIKVPPLRSRREDIIPLASHFIAKIAHREGMGEKSLTQSAKDALMSYSWPGNVRELENAIERAMILTDGPSITADAVTPGMEEGEEGTQPAFGAGTTIHDMEKGLIMSTLQSVDGNRTRAATLLGISIRTLRNKLNEYSGNSQFSDADRAEPAGEE